MEKTKILRMLFTQEELKEYLRKTYKELQEESHNGDYVMSSYYSLDLARIYEIMGFTKKSNKYYESALEYLDYTGFQSLTIRFECLLALGRPEEALEIAQNSNRCRRPKLASLYEENGKFEVAQRLYTELAEEKSKEINENYFFRPHLLQEVSDLWNRARNTREASIYNLKAEKEWEDMKDNIQSPLKPIEKAWLYEEVGYIYEKASQFGTAMEYYKKAEFMYEKGYTEDPDGTLINQVDGDWDYYKEHFFYLQFLGFPMYKLRVEHMMKYDHRRIRYRILNLKEKMKELPVRGSSI